MVEVGMMFPTNKDGDVEIISVAGNDVTVKFIVSGNTKVVVKCNLLKKMVADMEYRKVVAKDALLKKKDKDEIKAAQSKLKQAASLLLKSETRLRNEVIKRERLQQREVGLAIKKEVRLEVSKRKEKEAGDAAANRALMNLQKSASARELIDKVGLYSKVLLNDFKDSSGMYGRSITVDGKSLHTRSSAVWQCILQRCTQGSYFQTRFKHYVGTTICDEWKNSFQNFAEWYTKQVGYALGWDVDKDALTGTKHYSPATCLLLPRCVNLLFSEHHRGHSLSDATKLDGVPRWRSKDGTFFTCLEQAAQHQRNRKEAHVESLRKVYVPLGVPDMVFDKAVNFIKN